MFDGLQRRVRNTAHVMGFRISYAVASGVYSLQLAAEQVGSLVANNIDLVLTARGTGIVRTAGNFRVGTGGLLFFEDGNGWVQRTAGTNIMQFSPSGNASALTLTASTLNCGPLVSSFFLSGLSSFGAAGTLTIGPSLRNNNTGVGHAVKLTGGSGSTATTGSSGGAVTVVGGDSFGTAANVGGALYLGGGAPSSTAARGTVNLGYDSVNVSRVIVRNTILALNGYTTTATAATTTELPTAGDCGIHKNSSSGAVHLCFNDGGTIKSVQMT